MPPVKPKKKKPVLKVKAVTKPVAASKPVVAPATKPESKLTKLSKPSFRKLRGYAFDPSLSLTVDTVQVNNLTYKVEWEKLDEFPGDANGRTLPAGEYIEIIDFDAPSGLFYPPVDLDDRFLLAQDGLNPSVSNPQFHQQMVYAVIMTTIKNFEQALGRRIQWSQHRGSTDSGFVRRLRVYPHALRQGNAYYDPRKKALLFGYFPAQPLDSKLQLPGGTVFTCLSHDIIAHETTHAILDGLHGRYIENNHPDTRAFHEAFADIVALFQHFTFPEVLKHQVAKTRGNLASQNLLGQLAQQFGKAMGSYGSLRDAIGTTDPVTGEWKPHIPDPSEYSNTMEFHDRGAILVAAVFDAFLTIYKQRIQKILRVGSGGTGVLDEGALHPDLVDLLAQDAADTASRILRICVRALDYCPPVDISFGDYLRAIITADVDMVADDDKNYRVAFIEAFQKRGIFPPAVKSMSVESLVYEPFPELQLDGKEISFTEFLRGFKQALSYETDRQAIDEITKEYITGSEKAKAGIHARFKSAFFSSDAGKKITGLLFPGDEIACNEKGLRFSEYSQTATFQVENLSLASRITPDGKIVNNVIVKLLQQRGVRYKIDDDGEFSIKSFFVPGDSDREDGFIFRGGCTLIFDLDKMKLKYVIKKDIDDDVRIAKQYRYVYEDEISGDASVYFSNRGLANISGPFSFMHTFEQSHNTDRYE